jgi:hypothetical protein
MTSRGLFPATEPARSVVMPHPLASGMPGGTTPDLSGTIDGVSAKIAVIPDSTDQSGIIVKWGSSTWGLHSLAPGGDPDYGKGQFISFHKWGTGLSDTTNNTLMYRVDKTGGVGFTGGMHVATGLRQAVGYSVTQAIWVNPSLDTTHIAMTGFAGQTLPYLLAVNSVGSVMFEVFASGGVQSAGDIAARIGTAQQVAIGNVAGFAAINFGNDGTTFLARTSNPTYLQVTNHLQATGELIAEYNQVDKQVVIGSMYGTYAGIGFGTALDAVIWRAFPGFISCSDGFHVKNVSHPTTAVLTLQNAAGQTGKAIRGLNSAGAEIWSIDANGILSTAGGAFPPSSGTWTMKDALTVQNNGSTANTVLAAIGASGQSGYLIAGVQNTGGVVFSVTNAGAVAVAGNLGVSGTSFVQAIVSTSINNGSGGITNAGAISGASTINASSTVTCTAVSATGGTSFFAAISVSSVASTGAIQATSYTATSGSSSLRGISNNNNGITSCGSITGCTTISCSSTGTFSAISATGGTSFVAGLSGSAAWATSSSMSANNYITTSSRRLKKSIEQLGHDEHRGLLDLKPSRFQYRKGNSDTHIGLIAEDVKAIVPEAVTTDEFGNTGINYNMLVTLLVAAYQDVSRRLAELEAR